MHQCACVVTPLTNCPAKQKIVIILLCIFLLKMYIKIIIRVHKFIIIYIIIKFSFFISRIIKVSVSVLYQQIVQTSTLITLDLKKASSNTNNCLLAPILEIKTWKSAWCSWWETYKISFLKIMRNGCIQFMYNCTYLNMSYIYKTYIVWYVLCCNNCIGMHIYYIVYNIYYNILYILYYIYIYYIVYNYTFFLILMKQFSNFIFILFS